MVLNSADLVSRLAYCGQYEREVKGWLRTTVRQGDITVDVGANTGVIASMLSQLVGTCGEVVCFEPNPSCLETLSQLQASGLNNLVILPFAVADSSGSVALYESRVKGNSGLNSLYPHQDIDSTRSSPVPSLSLDDYFGLWSRRARVLKIDVEGAEDRVLAGARHLLETGFVEYVVLEVSPNFRSLGWLGEFFSSLESPVRFFLLSETGRLRRKVKVSGIDLESLVKLKHQCNVVVQFMPNQSGCPA